MSEEQTNINPETDILIAIDLALPSAEQSVRIATGETLTRILEAMERLKLLHQPPDNKGQLLGFFKGLVRNEAQEPHVATFIYAYRLSPANRETAHWLLAELTEKLRAAVPRQAKRLNYALYRQCQFAHHPYFTLLSPDQPTGQSAEPALH